VIGLLFDLTYAIGADAVGRRFRTQRGGNIQRYLVGGIYLSIAALAAVSAFS